MNVVYIATDSYTSILGVSMLSLLVNAKDLKELDIYLLSDDLKNENKDVLLELADEYNRAIHFIDIFDYKQAFDFDFDTSGFHSIVLARLLLTQYLPDDLRTILYLDCDTIVNGSLTELESREFENKEYAFAAVPELYMPQKQKKYLGLDTNDIYFNCGVLLINLDFWRKQNLQQVFIEYYSEMQGKLMYNDQDILNHCCKGKILPLSHKYNLPPVLYYFPRYFIKNYQPAYYCKNMQEYKYILKNPVIIHYLGEERPWVHGNFSPYRKIYDYYKSISIWKSEPLIYGKEKVLFCYHILNCITFICPWFRKTFTQWIGIRYYELVKKK